jgi:hypothetical protein
MQSKHGFTGRTPSVQLRLPAFSSTATSLPQNGTTEGIRSPPPSALAGLSLQAAFPPRVGARRDMSARRSAGKRIRQSYRRAMKIREIDSLAEIEDLKTTIASSAEATANTLRDLLKGATGVQLLRHSSSKRQDLIRSPIGR